jgi:uncharacterized membrane protein
MILSQSIIIERTAQDVFQYYADFRRHKEFIALLDATALASTQEAFGMGSEFVEKGDMLMGGKIEMRSKITRFEPPKRVTCISIDGGNQIEQDFEVVPMNPNSCTATYTVRVTPPSGLFSMASTMLSPFLKHKVKRQLEADMQKFKSLLEQGYDRR